MNILKLFKSKRTQRIEELLDNIKQAYHRILNISDDLLMCNILFDHIEKDLLEILHSKHKDEIIQIINDEYKSVYDFYKIRKERTLCIQKMLITIKN